MIAVGMAVTQRGRSRHLLAGDRKDEGRSKMKTAPLLSRSEFRFEIRVGILDEKDCLRVSVDRKYTKDDLESFLRSNDVGLVTDALLYLCCSVEDREWIQDKCLELFEHEDEDVSGLAVTCLGHVARIHSTINKNKVVPVLRQKLNDRRLAGRAQDALDDIRKFTKG